VKVGIDNSYLTLLLNPSAPASVPNATARIRTLVADLTDHNATVIIPAPVLTECLLKEGTAIQETLEKLRGYSCFQVRPFDQRAAIELAVILRGDTKGSAREARKVATASKIRFDKQLVTILKVQEATTLYSDDADLCNFAEDCGLRAVRLVDLPMVSVQSHFEFQHEKT